MKSQHEGNLTAILPATFWLIWPRWQHDTRLWKLCVCNPSLNCRTDLVSSHPSLPLSPPLYLFSLVDSSLFPALPLLLQITSRRWLIRSASSSGNTDRSWKIWDESGSGRRRRRRRRATSRRRAGSDSILFWEPIRSGVHIKELWVQMWLPSRQELAKGSRDSLVMMMDCFLSSPPTPMGLRWGVPSTLNLEI